LFLVYSPIRIISVTPDNSSDPPRLLNYLTAPHVLVWSAAVASSSLPGVFEANRLKVRDADGTERYESAESAKFSDGSMEQDLPMQQLSEMFNVNHFIVSQANPHAVMFASYNQRTSVWINPLTGMMNAVLTFLKDRVRSWIGHTVELLGARRIAPLHATSRTMMAQFFTQEYEGRACDISLIPWLSHRSAFSALMHCLYNPTEEEFRSWIEAAERETWKHLPAIKSHIAEEVTLDRCVQRLRKRVLVESWEKHRRNSTSDKMGDRVPSFFTSPSLVNLGGMGVTDQTNVSFEQCHAKNLSANQMEPDSKINTLDPHTVPSFPSIDMNSGWSGLGLRGNRSFGKLERSSSDASGLFIDGDDSTVRPSGQDTSEQGTTAIPIMALRQQPFSSVNREVSFDKNGYIKTTSMAQFYYRKTGSYQNLIRSRSHESSPAAINTAAPNTLGDSSSPDNLNPTHTRRKSRSHTDLAVSNFSDYNKLALSNSNKSESEDPLIPDVELN
jgi:predicted acylesterase/phospholipase RssA